MNNHVLLNSLMELVKRDKMHGLLSILLLFCSEYNTSIRHAHACQILFSYDPNTTLKSRYNKTLRLCHIYPTLLWMPIHNVT